MSNTDYIRINIDNYLIGMAGDTVCSNHGLRTIIISKEVV